MVQSDDVRLMMQAFTTYMQQQVVQQQQQMSLNEEGKVEVSVQKALEAVIEELKLFDGRNSTQYLKAYLSKMEMYAIPIAYRARNFERVVKQEIKEQVREIFRIHGGNWEDFGRGIKASFYLEDDAKVTRKSFMEWIDIRGKNISATELLDNLRTSITSYQSEKEES